MYSNKKMMNDVPMKKLIPFFSNDNSTRRYSYTDGMSIRNEGRRPVQNNIPSPQYIEKLQKKLLQTLETNYEINKKYGNMLSNNESSSPKPYPTAAEQKRSAAIFLLRKRTNNIINNANGDSINSYRKGSVDDYLLTHHKTNNKVNQRQQALSILMRRVSNTNTKKNDNFPFASINTDFRKFSYDSIQNPSVNNNTFNNNRLDLQNSNLYNRNLDIGSYYNPLFNYDMSNSPSTMSSIPPAYMSSVEATHSPSLNTLKSYDMNNSSNISNTLSPISPSTNFMNSFASTARKSVNLGSVAKNTQNNSRIFENNRLIPNDLSYFDINSCPSSPLGNFAPSGSFFNNNNRNLSPEELSQKIAENQIMIDYLSKLCTNTGDINDKETSLFTNNMLNTTKLPPAYLNNDINISDYTMQSPPFTSSSNRSSPTQADGTSPFLNHSFRKFSLNDLPNPVNNFPTPYVNTNKVITPSTTMPSSPYLGNSKVNISPYPGDNGNSNGANANINSPKFNATPSSSPYIGMGGMAGIGIDKSQSSYKRNQSNAYVNNLMGRGIPSPSPSFSNSSNGNGNSRFMINSASPGLYPNMNVNDISPSALMNDVELQNKYNSKSMPSSPSFGFSEPNIYQNQNGNVIPSVMEQQRSTFYNNKLNTMMSSMYNNNSAQKSQSIIPAYTSTTSVSSTQIPSPNIGAIGRPSVTKLLLDDEQNNTNPLSSLAFEKQKTSPPPASGDNISDDFSKLSLGQNSNSSKFQNFHNASTLLSSGIPPISNFNFSNNMKNGNNDQELSVMEPNPNLFSSNVNSTTTSTMNSSLLNSKSDEKPYKLFDDKNVYDFINNTNELTVLKNFESSNAVQNQSLEDSPLINSLEDKNFSTYNIDMQITSDAFSNNSNNNNMFSLSMQHPVLS